MPTKSEAGIATEAAGMSARSRRGRHMCQPTVVRSKPRGKTALTDPSRHTSLLNTTPHTNQNDLHRVSTILRTSLPAHSPIQPSTSLQAFERVAQPRLPRTSLIQNTTTTYPNLSNPTTRTHLHWSGVPSQTHTAPHRLSSHSPRLPSQAPFDNIALARRQN
ncbi:hypothetical protein BDV95DRAFT_22120 [Massariosphaeria phaeospora]|uniref:Uncharacterized protein n=1 Tax=Massariosphaeria phaeospora TaxID=100035 RepID=A0A7C8IK87_9PLEO|nr:hypothetical protein BDV95DRAFT_22120 [Massariosphaeria phaeospora]